MRFQKPSDRFFKHLHSRRQLNPAGNVLIYVVVLMLIFGVLGIVMVSLFTSTTASTVTRNDSRRARYMAESGMRYAFSEMRKADFDLNHMISTESQRAFSNTQYAIIVNKEAAPYCPDFLKEKKLQPLKDADWDRFDTIDARYLEPYRKGLEDRFMKEVLAK